MTKAEIAEAPEQAMPERRKEMAAPPRRVLYVNTWSSCHGGSSTSLLDIVANLDRTRYEPFVLCPEPGPLPDRLEQLGISITLHSLKPLTRRHFARFTLEVPWYLRFLKRTRISLVHGNTGCWRRSVVLACRLRGIPYVQHVRNPIEAGDADFAMRYASRIVTNSHQVGESLRSDARFRDRMQTIYNAVDLARYEQNENRRGEFGAGDRPIVGIVGQIVHRKGMDIAIRAMRSVVDHLPQALLVIVGMSPPGDESFERECRALIDQLGLRDNVHWTGFRTDVPAWMRTFDVFVLPTRSEPFGKVIVEAMAAGCPVVASNVGGIPEIINHEALGTLVALDDVEATAAAVLGLLQDRTHARRISAAARQHVEQHFSLRSMIDQLQRLYDDILDVPVDSTSC